MGLCGINESIHGKHFQTETGTQQALNKCYMLVLCMLNCAKFFLSIISFMLSFPLYQSCGTGFNIHFTQVRKMRLRRMESGNLPKLVSSVNRIQGQLFSFESQHS